MARNVWKWVAVVLVCIFVSPQQVWAFGAGRSGGSLLSLPERLAYKVLSVPGRVGRAVFPRTTANVRNYANSAERMTGKAVRGTTQAGKRVLLTTGKIVEGAFKTTSRLAGDIAGTVARVARYR